jgi:hypothetical protein
MSQLNPFYAVLLTAISIALLAPAVAVAQGFPNRDAREISSYALTETALAKYTQATANLGDMSKQVLGNCDDDDGEGASSLNESAARIDAVPGAQAAIRSAGMTTREYVVVTWSLFEAGMAAWALEQPGGTIPPGVSRANVDFVRAHKASLEKLDNQGGSDLCEETEGEESEEPEEELTE